jgi:hypothetical protein
MYTVVVAAMQRSVVAVDADPRNLAYIRSSLLLGGNHNHVRLLYNAIRWGQELFLTRRYAVTSTQPSTR